MILEYDRSPNATFEQRMNSLTASVQRAFDEIDAHLGDSINISFSEAKTSKSISSGQTMAELFGQIKKNERNIKCESIEVGNIDYTITDDEYDELIKLLGGGS